MNLRAGGDHDTSPPLVSDHPECKESGMLPGAASPSPVNVLTGVLVLGFVLPSLVRGEDELFMEVCAGNKSAIQSLDTIHCRITRASPVSVRGAIPPSTAEYWRGSDSYRVRYQDESGFSDCVRHDYVTRSLAKSRDPGGRERVHYVIARADPGQPHGRFDAWSLGLLTLFGPSGQRLTLDELLQTPVGPVEASQVAEKGRDYVVLKLSAELMADELAAFEIWFDPQVNYLACKLVGTSAGKQSNRKNSRRETEVVGFKEVSPALYFPERVETKFYRNDQLVQHDVVSFSDIRVNQPLPADIFRLDIPGGAEVTDMIQNEEYKVDSAGQPLDGKASIAAYAPLSPATAETTDTVEEPQPLTRWIVPVALGALLVASAIWLVRKFRMSFQE
jgi:hypothetical protein